MSKIIIVITTYNRPGHLIQLLRDIVANKEKHPLCIRVYDDGSTENYNSCIEFLTNRNDFLTFWHNSPVNHGKRDYWQLMNMIMGDLANLQLEQDDFIIQLPDDVRLFPGFFTKAVGAYRSIPDKKKACLNLLFDINRKGKPCWTGMNPTLHTFGDYSIYHTAWMDMCYICTPAMFERLDYKVMDPGNAWFTNPDHSSGMGKQISGRLHKMNLGLYQVASSYVMHGSHPSVMHPETRKKHPLVSYTKPGNIIAGMASIPNRRESLRKVVSSILDQVDELHVYLNGYGSVPVFLQHKKITVYRSQDHDGDLGDAGKFYACEKAKDFFLTIDDDLIYPPDYVATLINHIELYQRRCVVSVHGRILNDAPIESYYKGGARKVYRCLKEMEGNRWVNIVGTGVLAYHVSTLQVKRSDFKAPNMADIWFSKLANDQQVPLLVIGHQKGWIEHHESIVMENTIAYHHRHHGDELQTKIVNEVNWTIHEIM